MNSITQILDKLPMKTKFKEEIYQHSRIPRYVESSGDFDDAFSKKLVLATVTEDSDHAVALFGLDTKTAELICKNSYHTDIIHRIPLHLELPLYGYCITFNSA